MGNIINKNLKFKFIYKITNLINGKIYVGSHITNNINDGYLGSGVVLYKAIQKYGKENFKLEILEFYLGDNKKDLFELELKWIENLRSIEKEIGYNLTKNCGGGYISEEVYNKMKIDFKGRKIWCEGLTLSKEHKNKIGVKTKGENNGMFGVKGVNHPCYGKPGTNLGKNFTQEHKNKISESQSGEKGYWFNINSKDHPMWGKKHSEESIRKNRESNLNKPEIECNYCGFKSISKGAMIQWHFDNCKHKNKIL